MLTDVLMTSSRQDLQVLYLSHIIISVGVVWKDFYINHSTTKQVTQIHVQAMIAILHKQHRLNIKHRNYLLNQNKQFVDVKVSIASL